MLVFFPEYSYFIFPKKSIYSYIIENILVFMLL